MHGRQYYGRKFIFNHHPRLKSSPIQIFTRPIPVGYVEAEFDDLELATVEAVNEAKRRLIQERGASSDSLIGHHLE